MNLSRIPLPVRAERPPALVRSNSAPSVLSTRDTRPALPESIGELSVLQSLDLGDNQSTKLGRYESTLRRYESTDSVKRFCLLGNPIIPDVKFEENYIFSEKNIDINILNSEKNYILSEKNILKPEFYQIIKNIIKTIKPST